MTNIIERLRQLKAIYPVTSDRVGMGALIEVWEALPKLLAVVSRAEALRAAQRLYMADRGNEELGKAVGKAAAEVDEALAALDSKP